MPVPEQRLSRQQQLGVALCTALIATLWVWSIATGALSSPGGATVVILAMGLVLVLFVFVARPRRTAPGEHDATQAPAALPRDVRRRLTFMSICLGLIVVLVAMPLVAGAPIASAAPLFVVIVLGILGIAYVWRQGRVQPQTVRSHGPKQGVRVIVSLAIFIPSLALAGWVYTALADSAVLALILTFLTNLAVGLLITWVDDRIVAAAPKA